MLGHFSILWRFNILAAGRCAKALGFFPGIHAVLRRLRRVSYPFPMGMHQIWFFGHQLLLDRILDSLIS
jgi:hypothetical protein